jgi:hypothetical protein
MVKDLKRWVDRETMLKIGLDSYVGKVDFFKSGDGNRSLGLSHNSTSYVFRTTNGEVIRITSNGTSDRVVGSLLEGCSKYGLYMDPDNCSRNRA